MGSSHNFAFKLVFFLISSFPPQECPNKDIMCAQKTGPIDVYEVIAAPLEPKMND